MSGRIVTDRAAQQERWLAEFIKAVKSPLRIDSDPGPLLEYERGDIRGSGYGTPPDAAVVVRTERYLASVSGTMELDILLPVPPAGCGILCDNYPSLIGPGIDEDGLDIISYLDGHTAIIGLVDDAVRGELSDYSLGEWRQMTLRTSVSGNSLTYGANSLILTVLVDYEAPH